MFLITETLDDKSEAQKRIDWIASNICNHEEKVMLKYPFFQEKAFRFYVSVEIVWSLINSEKIKTKVKKWR